MTAQTSKASQRELVISLRSEGLTYAAIGRKLNISGEFARQIFNEDGYLKRKKPNYPMVADVLLTTSQAAKILNVHTNTIRRWSDSKILTTFRIGSRGDRRYRLKDVRQLLRK
jgi:excisionase family DNA binding protein